MDAAAAGTGPRDDPDRAPQNPAAASSLAEAAAAAGGVKTETAGGAESPAPARAEPGGAAPAAAAGRGGETVAEASASEPTAEATEVGGPATAAAPATGEDGDGGAGEEGRAAVLSASEVARGGIAGGSRDVDPAVSGAKMEVVDEGGDASKQKQCSPSCTVREVGVGRDPGAVGDLAPVASEVEVEVEVDGVRVQEQECVGSAGASEVKMEVDGSCVGEQECVAASEAGKAKMEEADGRVVEGDGSCVREQECAGSAGVSAVKMEVDDSYVGEQECAGAAGAGEAKMEEADGRVVEDGDSGVRKQGCARLAGASEVKMEVDDSRIRKQECAGTAVAGEVEMVEADGRVVDQGPAGTSGGGLQVPAKEVGECLVGRYIGRHASGHASVLIGKVASYDSTADVYSVVFEDEHAEDLSLPQIQEFLIPDENGMLGMKVSCRKRKLDLLVLSGSASEVKEPATSRQRVDGCEMPANPDELQCSRSGSDMSEDIESSSNSSDFTKEEPSEPCPPVQAVELPPSSGDILVPEDSISYLFSVYNFLRSFSVQLFLSPFGLDDFVAAINCAVQNNLLDAVHVSLLRALKRHLESKSAEGSQMASNCLKYLDWTLLDALTWPTFLLEHLCMTGCIKNLGGKSFARNLLAAEFYKLPVATKLRVLQILCDHVLESEEFKTALEDRVGYNEEMEYDIDSSTFLEAGSRAVSTRASKASAYKMMNDLQNFESAPNVTNPDVAVANVSQDGNSDDCRICGMDGTLVCCDGCPWAYHSRCIGQNKAFLPHGDWFCPECVVNKLGPTSSRIERGARGAQMFGIDMCGRLFLGTCNYLLVIGTSSDVESYARYYNHYDVVKVLQRLAPSDAYADICSQIMEYWKHLPGRVQSERSTISKEVGTRHTPQSNMLSFTPTKSGDGSGWTTLKDGGDSKPIALPQINAQQKFVANQYTVCSAEHLEKQKCMSSLSVISEKNVEVRKEALSAQNNIHNAPRNGNSGPFVPPSISHKNESVGMGLSNIAQAQPAHSIYRPDLCTVSAKAESYHPSLQGKHHLQLFTERSGNMSCGKAAKLSSFKPQAYMNLYNHGNIAASAAANLAVITSDEGKVSASQLTLKPKKKVAADNALQLKAFSSAVAQFVWPSTEKKLMEVPRDRCGWCLACRSSASGNKKACFLNMTTTNAAKGSARVLSTMRVIKHSDSHFPSIAAYLASMEESLRSLLVGSLQAVQQRERWRQQLEEASNCRTVIPLLLELESNIRGVAFSASWLKPIDDWPVESTGTSTGASRPAQYQKRGAAGRRGRRRLLASESGTGTDDDNSWTWWTGGNIIKRTLQRGALLHSTMRKAARQGGKKRIAGLSYHEGSNFPRRSRQFFWRACVGLSQTSSQLALQVRYLDAHIRWKEFIPPDQIPSDGKSSDADLTALRNAVLCDKKIIDNKIRYALKFPNQKHLSVRLTKNILEEESDQDESRKLWFSENHVPLYMLREFEQHAEASSLPTPEIPDSNWFSKLYPRRVKASDGDVFSYLFHKGEVYPCTSCKKDVLYRDIVKCSSCQGNCHKECTPRSVVSQGGSTTSSLICKLCLEKWNLMLTSYNTNASYIQHQQKSNGQQPVVAPRIVFKVSSSHSAEPAPKVEAEPVTEVKAQPVVKVEATTQPVVNVKAQPLVKVETQPLAKVATQNITSVQKAKAKKSKSGKPTKAKKVQPITYFGLVWKKNKNDKDDGSEFRANNVILKSKDGIGSSIKPKCCLCDKAYSPDFLYVRCEKCTNWFHGDSLQLDEDRLGELLGYRCCRCRRRAIPPCPYSDNYVKPEPEFSEQTVATSSLSTMLSSEETFALADQDPLLASYGIVEPIGEETRDVVLSANTSSIGPGSNQKLSIRRAQTKISEYLDQAGKPVNEYCIQNTPSGNGNVIFSHTNEISFSEADSVDASELLGWDFSKGTAYAAHSEFTSNHQQNDTSCGSFVMDEYEPQTYFSFTELLEADDAQLDNAFGMAPGLQDDVNDTGSFVQQGVGFDDVSFMVEDGPSNMNFPTNDPTPEELACRNCMHTQPSPDLKCSVCGLRIHRQCSPWDQGVEPVESGNWSCGGCRRWQ